MPLDLSAVRLAIESGTSAVCATCDHYWDAIDRAAPSCGQQCGGPMSGMAFDKYKGPVTDLSRFCFVCMAPPSHAVRAKGNVRVLGCCRQHIDLISKLKPVDKPAVDVITKSADGSSTEIASTKVIPDRVKLVLGND